MSADSKNDGLQALENAYAGMQSAIDEFKASSLAEIKNETVNRVIECGVFLQKVREVEMLAQVKLVGPEEVVQEVRNEIANLQRVMQFTTMEAMDEKMIALIEYLHEQIVMQGEKVTQCCKQAREYYEQVYPFLRELQLAMDAIRKQNHEPPIESQEFDAKPEEEKVSAVKEFIEALTMALELARRNAESQEERVELHEVFESLRLAEDLIENAGQQNQLTDEMLAAQRKVCRAHDIIVQAWNSVNDAKKES